MASARALVEESKVKPVSRFGFSIFKSEFGLLLRPRTLTRTSGGDCAGTAGGTQGVGFRVWGVYNPAPLRCSAYGQGAGVYRVAARMRGGARHRMNVRACRVVSASRNEGHAPPLGWSFASRNSPAVGAYGGACPSLIWFSGLDFLLIEPINGPEFVFLSGFSIV